jgi:hypothetical protein
MIGNTIVETEYMGRRRHLRNSYFVSFKQMLNTLGFIGMTGLIAVVAIVVLLSLLSLV